MTCSSRKPTINLAVIAAHICSKIAIVFVAPAQSRRDQYCANKTVICPVAAADDDSMHCFCYSVAQMASFAGLTYCMTQSKNI